VEGEGDQHGGGRRRPARWRARALGRGVGDEEAAGGRAVRRGADDAAPPRRLAGGDEDRGHATMNIGDGGWPELVQAVLRVGREAQRSGPAAWRADRAGKCVRSTAVGADVAADGRPGQATMRVRVRQVHDVLWSKNWICMVSGHGVGHTRG
jgi:hypothetical protein